MKNKLAAALTLEDLLEEVVSDERSVSVALHRLAQILLFLKHSAQSLRKLTRATLILAALLGAGGAVSTRIVAWHAADAASVDGLVDLERRWAHLSWLFLGLVVSRRSHTSLLGTFHVGTSARHELFFLIILTLVINFFFVRVCLVVDHFAEAFERPGNLVTAALGVLYFDNAGHARPNTASILICSNLVETHFKLIFLSFH